MSFDINYLNLSNFNINYFILLVVAVIEVIIVARFIKKRIRSSQKIHLLGYVNMLINLGSFSIPFVIYFFPQFKLLLWDLSLYAVFFLMSIRPIKDIFPKLKFAKLMILRKSLGIFSAIIVVFFGVFNYVGIGSAVFSQYFSLAFWSIKNNIFWGRLGELTGFILLITSNNLSMRLLKRNWKRVQKLSYIYLFAGSWFVFINFQKTLGIISIIVVFCLTLVAFFKKRIIKNEVNLLRDKEEQILASLTVLIFIVGLLSVILMVVSLNTKMGSLNQKLVEVSSDTQLQLYGREISKLMVENKDLQYQLGHINSQGGVNG